MNKLFASFCIVIIFIFPNAFSQEVPQHISNESIYDFIDELANKHIIEINSAVKPYSRIQIAQFLSEANTSNNLTPRQRKEINFYLKDYNKELHKQKDFDKRFDVFYYSDSTFKLSVNGILGGRAYYNGNDLVQHRWNGAQFFGYWGNRLSFYGSLRDNYESESLGGPDLLTQHPGAVYKLGADKKDYSEARGGIIYNWKSGSIGIVKDHFAWGNNYHGSNIFSGRTPSFAQIKFHFKPVKWLEVNYIHGWLASEVVDSARSYNLYNDTRRVFTNKFLAANLFTLKPWKKFNFSFGNSIIYSDGNINPTYFIPFLFYKSADHSYNGSRNSAGHNTQMFFDISSRQIKNLHLYTSVFIDEIAISNMFDKEKQSNFISIKLGARATDLLPNLSLTAEYTRSNPFTYTHYIPSLTYESNHYNLGHYLKDNADEIYTAIRYKPIRGLDLLLSYTHLRKGLDNQKLLEENEEIENLWGGNRKGYAFMEEERFSKNALKLTVQYQIINDAFIYVDIEKYSTHNKETYNYLAEPYLNNNTMLAFGLNFGF